MSDPIFFPVPEPVALGFLAERAQAELVGDAAKVVVGVAPLDLAVAGDLTFLDNTRYARQLADTQATACVLSRDNADKLPEGVAGLITANPYRAYAEIARLLYPNAIRLTPVMGEVGVSSAAIVHETAVLEEDVTIEAGVIVGPRAEIGSGTVIGPGAVVGADVRIGRDCSIAANVTVTHALLGDRVMLYTGCRIGQDGFGYAMGPQGHLKLPQVGRVVLQDDVEVGANSTVDRGANRDTVIGQGTKIDNQVQIGHNVVIGRHCVLVSQSGVAGSTVLGDFVVLGGQVGLTGHISVGAGSRIAGGSVVSNNIPAGEKWIGVPAQPLRAWARARMAVRALTSGKRRDNKTLGDR